MAQGMIVDDRIHCELELLKRAYGSVEFRADGSWFLISQFDAPPPWVPTPLQISFNLRVGYPGVPPYGFFAPTGITCGGQQPTNVTQPGYIPPFGGSWIHFSWQPETWYPTANTNTGSNLLAWVRSFRERFRQGP